MHTGGWSDTRGERCYEICKSIIHGNESTTYLPPVDSTVSPTKVCGIVMVVVHATVGTLVITLNLAAGIWGGWYWWRGKTSPIFWPLLRSGQAVLIVQILIGATLIAQGHRAQDLHVLYGLLPLGVSFIGEQLRVASTDAVLKGRGVVKQPASELPEVEQNAVVAAVMRREMGVMAATASVVAVLALRAAQVGGLF